MKYSPKNIYLADDDRDDRLLFTDALGELTPSTKVTTFENGVDLMANLLDKEKGLPDFIFLDLNMPMMNGEECLADIRNELRLNEIPVIIYSGYYDEMKVAFLQKKGADRYLQKPRSFEQLKFCLQRCIESLEQSALKIVPVPQFVIK